MFWRFKTTVSVLLSSSQGPLGCITMSDGTRVGAHTSENRHMVRRPETFRDRVCCFMTTFETETKRSPRTLLQTLQEWPPHRTHHLPLGPTSSGFHYLPIPNLSED